MCGIYGTVRRYSDEVVKKKLELMEFRGPDHQGFVREKCASSKEVILGHDRLAIMDLDKRSNQPFMFNDQISIVFNGEIYNFNTLKSQYLSDVRLRTTSDTEVLCALYEKLGMGCLKVLNGMFSFVIFDKRKNILVGGRDRLGKKPFYYWWDEKGFEFASQPSPIRYSNDMHIDERSRSYMLLLGYIPDPYCIYKEMRKLRAGQCFTYDIAKNRLDISTYWDLFSNSCGFSKPKSYEEAKEVVGSLLEDAVKIRLNADVPVGMFLSGGIDSSLTSAVIAKLNKNICAYTIGFEDKKYNESQHATEVAKHLGIPIKVNLCEHEKMMDIFKDYYKYYDEPFADNSLIPTSLLAQETRRDVTVAIGGDGGDELFYGYSTYKRNMKTDVVYTYSYPLRKALCLLLSPFDVRRLDQIRFKNVKEAVVCLGNYGKFRKARSFDYYELGYQLPDYGYLNDERGWLQYSDFDMKQYMNSCINTKTDRASMRSSLELRSPLMDYRLAEYSRLLPIEYLYDKSTGGVN